MSNPQPNPTSQSILLIPTPGIYDHSIPMNLITSNAHTSISSISPANSAPPISSRHLKRPPSQPLQQPKPEPEQPVQPAEAEDKSVPTGAVVGSAKLKSKLKSKSKSNASEQPAKAINLKSDKSDKSDIIMTSRLIVSTPEPAGADTVGGTGTGEMTEAMALAMDVSQSGRTKKKSKIKSPPLQSNTTVSDEKSAPAIEAAETVVKPKKKKSTASFVLAPVMDDSGDSATAKADSKVADSSYQQMVVQPTMNIGTIGHVAHGKSTLARALSGANTARSVTELKRNMTIKLGYANVKIFQCTAYAEKKCPAPNCYSSYPSSQMENPICTRAGCGRPTKLIRHISLVDSPGHHDLMTVMMTGAAVMDGAMLVVAANEVCPSPQTAEHVTAARLCGTRIGVCVQNKIDMCSPQECIKHKSTIDSFLERAGVTGNGVYDPPVIPTAAQHSINTDALCAALVTNFPLPERDLISPARMVLVRTFDINKPGKPASGVSGGVVGGSLIRGVLTVGDWVEIRPGLIQFNSERRVHSYSPLRAQVLALHSESQALPRAVPGGLIAVQLNCDPALTKSDRLVGQTLCKITAPADSKDTKQTAAAEADALPPVFTRATLSFKLMKRLSGPDASDSAASAPATPASVSSDLKDVKTPATAAAAAAAAADLKSSSEKLFQPKPLSGGDRLLLCIGSTRVECSVESVDKKSKPATKKNAKPKIQRFAHIVCRSPVCASVGDRVAIFQLDPNGGRHWRMSASAQLTALTALKPSPLPAVSLSSTGSGGASDLAPIELDSFEAEGSVDAKSAAAAPAAARPDPKRVVTNPLSDLATARKTLPFVDTIDPSPPGGAGNTTANTTAAAAPAAMDETDETAEERADRLASASLIAQTSRARYYRARYPCVGELVRVRVTSMDEPDTVGAYVTLTEYGGHSSASTGTGESKADSKDVKSKVAGADSGGALTGLIMSSEISKRKKLKTLRNELSVGKEYTCVVLRVDPVRGHIDCSRKRVEPAEDAAFMDWLHRAKCLHSILGRTSVDTGVSVSALYEWCGWLLYARFGEKPPTDDENDDESETDSKHSLSDTAVTEDHPIALQNEQYERRINRSALAAKREARIRDAAISPSPHPLDALAQATTTHGRGDRSVLEGLGLCPELISALIKHTTQRLRANRQPTTVKTTIEVSCYAAPSGGGGACDAVRRALTLSDAEKKISIAPSVRSGVHVAATAVAAASDAVEGAAEGVKSSVTIDDGSDEVTVDVTIVSPPLYVVTATARSQSENAVRAAAATVRAIEARMIAAGGSVRTIESSTAVKA